MDKEQLLREKDNLEKELAKIRSAIDMYEYEEAKSFYGDKYSCEHCAYSAIWDYTVFGDMACGIGEELGCGPCGRYLPDNNVSRFIKDKFAFFPTYAYNGLSQLLSCDIINCNAEKQEKAIKIIDILDFPPKK